MKKIIAAGTQMLYTQRQLWFISGDHIAESLAGRNAHQPINILLVCISRSLYNGSRFRRIIRRKEVPDPYVLPPI
jgi:hypothetical protein